MFPPFSTKTYLTVSPALGPTPEPAISNEQFLNSYLDAGCWLRLLSSRQYLAVVENPKSSQLEKLAAVASFYQTAGLLVEDAIGMHVAWSLWALDKSRLLADILDRVRLRLSEPRSPKPTYFKDIQSTYVHTDKRLDVYARAYLTQLLASAHDDVPRLLGVNWKKNPSAKLVSKDQRATWDRMGYLMRESLEPLLDRKGNLLASCHNKIKHGPQLVVMPPSAAASRRGLSLDGNIDAEAEPTIRLLLSGARTQETQEEAQDSVRIAPFLLLNAENLRRWYFQQIVHISNVLFFNGTWIFNTTFVAHKRPLGRAPELEQITRDQDEHLRRTFKCQRSEG